ncbi:hypothetical protein WR25_26130 [Diploscapter pachys]|uniref:Exonuclease 1 n=1 Tax=Diploscapter pachys TaxID=2018661 RepID=A0A2A2J5L0_9BILA|nr:hypothetical protein WR25_26130 [Diploscapter pachys]
MGIQGLLPFVKKACREGDIREFRGHSIAVDVSCLLHKGIYACADKVVSGQDTKIHINYVKKYVDTLLALQCHVILVFDGRPLEAKKQTNSGRHEQRKSNLDQAKILMAKGQKGEAYAKLQRAASITGKIVESTIEAFRVYKNVDVIVSPYESDAQLAFLTREKLADAVITEDSDLIVFGCERIIFKWVVSSNCMEKNVPCTIYEKEKLASCFTGVSHQLATKFDFAKFRRICILSGCDYLQDGLKGVGLTKAVTFFTKVDDKDIRTAFKRIGMILRKQIQVSERFVDSFIKAEQTFAHQVVFDPRQRCQRPLNPYPKLEHSASQPAQKTTQTNVPFDPFISQPPSSSAEFGFAGEVLSTLLSTRLALGNSVIFS